MGLRTKNYSGGREIYRGLSVLYRNTNTSSESAFASGAGISTGGRSSAREDAAAKILDQLDENKKM